MNKKAKTYTESLELISNNFAEINRILERLINFNENLACFTSKLASEVKSNRMAILEIKNKVERDDES